MSHEYRSVIDTEWIGQDAIADYEQAMDRVQTSTMGIGEATQRTSSIMSRSWRNSIFTMQMGLFYFSMLESATYRQEAATIAIENAQDAYNQAVARYGAQSSQAVRAERTLERSRRYITTANRRAAISYIGLGLQTVNVSAELLKQAGITNIATLSTKINTFATNINVGGKLASVAATSQYIGATIAATAADWASSAALWAKAHAINIITFGLAAAAAAATMYAYSTMFTVGAMDQAAESAKNLHKEIGEAPSFGLVKGFEDLSAAIEMVSSPNINVNIRSAGRGIVDLERAMDEAKREVIRSARSIGL